MNRKIPPDAFSYYHSLGPGRSYELVAEHYGVSKRAVTATARRENWTERTLELVEKARESTNQKLAESLEDMNARHMKTLRFIRAKALDTLKSIPLSSAMEAVRALEMTIRQERVIRGEPTERAAINIEDVIRREYERWLVQPALEEAADRFETGKLHDEGDGDGTAE